MLKAVDKVTELVSTGWGLYRELARSAFTLVRR